VKSLAFVTLLLVSSLTAPAAPPAQAAKQPARRDTVKSELLASSMAPSEGVLAVMPWMRATLRLDGAARQTRFEPPRVASGPEIDGVLDDEVWAEAAVLGSFTHGRPVEGVRDSLGTVALVLYDDHHLYVAFHAGDDPAKVQAPIVPRDQVWQGDWVGISIDSYHDQQRSFFLCANPLGIQMDGIDQEGRDSDMAPDFQYTSRGRVTGDGYQVEMAIPFKTLRFVPGERVTFGFQAIRDVKRDGSHMYWAPISRDVNSYNGQLGTLAGLAGVRPGRNIEILPTHTTTTLGQRRASGLAFDDPRGRFGLGAKVGLTSNLIADVTMTPDFSQVEADAGVVDINERFAIFIDEKRPFFLEGNDIFVSPINLVYTRRIVDPLYGGKLTGKMGRTSIGVLSALDRSPGRGTPGLPDAVHPYLGSEAAYTIARFKQDVFKNSYIGLLLGDRTLRDQYNRGVGIDGRLRWRDRYSLTFQGVQSWAAEQDFRGALAGLDSAGRAAAPTALAALDGGRREGNAWSLSLERGTRNLSVGVGGQSFSPDFAADMGFIQRTDQLLVESWVRPHLWAKEKQWFTAIHFPMYYARTHAHGGDRLLEDVISVGQEVELPRNSWAGMENVRRFISHNGVDFADIFRHAVWAGSERFRTLRAGGLYVWGDQVVFAETRRGHDRRWELWADFRFGPQFDGGLFVRGSTVWRDLNDSRFAEVLIPRLRLSYQFSKELSLRWITELQSRRSYDVSGALTSRSETLTPDVLLSYYVRPGTVLYLGYGSILDGQDRDQLRPAQSSVFTKLSYLWQI
jgi:hypothetical protein